MRTASTFCQHPCSFDVGFGNGEQRWDDQNFRLLGETDQGAPWVALDDVTEHQGRYPTKGIPHAFTLQALLLHRNHLLKDRNESGSDKHQRACTHQGRSTLCGELYFSALTLLFG